MQGKLDNYEFTNQWFEKTAKPLWSQIINQSKPKKILEIGSYEGASTCYLIDTLSLHHDAFEINAIDTWDGGIEHKNLKINMQLVEERFKKNTSLAIKKSKKSIELITHKAKSINALSKLITSKKSGYFDFIYIDGSHMASDVLSDAILSFELLKINGIMGFDDYLWKMPNSNNLLNNPKIAIDSFTNIFALRSAIFQTPNHQLYIKKLN
tara:strand:+ start:169 stop:798 length:630 start_codon:yes stop_codon:yes gene_type:complete